MPSLTNPGRGCATMHMPRRLCSTLLLLLAAHASAQQQLRGVRPGPGAQAGIPPAPRRDPVIAQVRRQPSSPHPHHHLSHPLIHTPRRRLQERRKIRRSRCWRRPPIPLWLRRKAQRGSQASVARHRCTGRKPSPRKVEGRRRLRRNCPRTSHLRCPLLTTGGCRTNHQRRCKGHLHLQRCQPLPRL